MIHDRTGPPDVYRIPPPVGFEVGTVVAFAMKNTLTPPPNDVPLNPKFLLFLMVNNVAAPVRSVISKLPLFSDLSS